MGRYKIAYVAAVLLTGFGSVIATFAYPANELVLLTAGQMILAVLTFPLGAVAAAIGLGLIYTGFATTLETISVITPAYAVLGYIQWCRLFPAFYRSCG